MHMSSRISIYALGQCLVDRDDLNVKRQIDGNISIALILKSLNQINTLLK